MDKLQDAINAMARGDKKKARSLLHAILKDDQNNESAWLLMSQVIDDQQKKLECIKRALSINPRSGGAYTNLCLLYYRMGEYQKGLKSGRKAIELIVPSTPLKSQAMRYNNLSLCLAALGETEQAIEYAQKGIALAPHSLQIQENLRSFTKKLGKKRRNTVLLYIMGLLVIIFFMCRACANSVADTEKADISSIGEICTLYVEKKDADNMVMVPVDEEAYDAMLKAMSTHDDYAGVELILNGRVILIENDIRVRVIDMSLLGREVRVLQGTATGRSVWVPYEWLSSCKAP